MTQADAPAAPPIWTQRTVLVLVAFVTYFSSPYRALPQPNELSRLYLTRALVEQRSIDVLVQVQRHGLIHDLAGDGRRAFTDKAPGSSVVALAGYPVARMLATSGPLDNYTLARVARGLLLVPLSLFASLVVLPRVLRRLRVHDSAALIAGVALSVSSIWLTYSTLYFGHVLAGALLLMAYDALLVARESAQRRERWALLAGVLAGAAGAVEYPAIVAALALFGFCFVANGWRAALAMAAGAAPPAVLLLAYHQAAFGTPFTLPYRHLVWPEMMKEHQRGLAGVAWPTFEGLLGVLVGRARGLLMWAPIALLAPWGAARLWRTDRPAAAAAVAVVIAYGCIVTGSSVWHGGWALGPRLLVPILPFAVLLAAVALHHTLLERPALLPLALAPVLYGLAVVPSATAVFPGFSSKVAAPFPDGHLPLLACGVLPRNLGHAIGLDGLASLLPLAIALVAIALLTLWVVARHTGARPFALIAMLVAASGIFVATRGSRMPAVERAELVSWVSTLESKEPHRAGLPPRPCETQ